MRCCTSRECTLSASLQLSALLYALVLSYLFLIFFSHNVIYVIRLHYRTLNSGKLIFSLFSLLIMRMSFSFIYVLLDLQTLLLKNTLHGISLPLLLYGIKTTTGLMRNARLAGSTAMDPIRTRGVYFRNPL